MKVCNCQNVKVLTMSMVNPDQILLRFQHLMDRTEDEEPIVISLQVSGNLHCKKGIPIFPVPSRGMSHHKPNSPWPGIFMLLILFTDIPVEDGKITNLFLQCTVVC
jgi:hypothetical protein